MSVEAGPVISAPLARLPESPHQNNANHALPDDSVQSIALPDLTEILAAFNSKKKDTCSDEADDVEVREFGESLRQFNHIMPSGEILKPMAKAKPKPKKTRISKEPKPPREKKVKQKKVAAPKEPKAPRAKTIKKKNVTITGRAVSGFGQAESSLPEAPRPTDQCITKFLTPGRTNTANKITKPNKRASLPRKHKTEFSRIPLLTPAKALCNFRNQRFLFRVLKQSSSPPSLLTPSCLISLSKGHWYAGHRGPGGSLTDGGPDQFWPNQEQDDNMWELSQLQGNRLEALDEAGSTRMHNNDEFYHFNYRADSVESEPIDLEEGFEFPGTQTYLRELVGASGDESSDGAADFPVSCALPILTHHNTSETLKSALESEAHGQGTNEHDAEQPRPPISVKRPHIDAIEFHRNVSPKCSSVASPKSMHDLIAVDDSSIDGLLETDLIVASRGSSEPIDESLQPEPVSTEFRTAAAAEDSRILNIDRQVIQLDTTDDETHEPLVACRVPFMIPKVEDKSVPVSHSILPLVLDSSPPEMTQQAANQTAETVKTAVQDQGQKSSLGHRSHTKAKEYWVVPDSEDESSDSAPLASLIPRMKSLVPRAPASSASLPPRAKAVVPELAKPVTKQPNFNGYTTAQLQSELSSFGFKISKNRDGMVGLLNKCWEAKFQTPASSSQQRAASTKAAQSTTAPDEVLDLTIDPPAPADAISPVKSKPKASKKPKETALEKAERLASKAALKKQAAEQKAQEKRALQELKKAQKLATKESAALAKTESTRVLFTTLTALLRSKPGHIWWSRILSYEPIVLEDFTDWLKSKHDIETDVDTVRDYFDGQGVCCVKKMTRTGKDRKRF